MTLEGMHAALSLASRFHLQIGPLPSAPPQSLTPPDLQSSSLPYWRFWFQNIGYWSLAESSRRVRFYARSDFPWLGRSPVLRPYVQDPFPSKRGGILERDDLGLPVVPGRHEDRLGILKPLSVASCGPGGCSKHPEGGGPPPGRAASKEWLGDV